MSTTGYRPTTLKLASSNCPRAVDYYEQNRPYFREHFAQGIAAHDCLAGIGELAKSLGRSPDIGEMIESCNATVRQLITVGRRFEGEQEPPMPAEEANAGKVLALDYATNEGTTWPTEDVWYERGLAFDAQWRPVVYNSPTRRFRLILDMMTITEEGGEDYSGRIVVVRDYKSSWATDASELETIQMKGQAVAAALVLPDIDGVRREVVNLRTGQIFGETSWLESGGREQLAEWREEITAYMDALDRMRGEDGARPVRPGVGCLSCAWALSCESAAPMTADPISLGQQLGKLEGQRATLIKMLKESCSERPVKFDRTSVGYHAKPKREPKPDATRAAFDEWVKHDGDLDGFLAALGPSLGGLENVAELLVKKMASANEQAPDKSAAENLAAQWIDVKIGREFGVTRKERE